MKLSPLYMTVVLGLLYGTVYTVLQLKASDLPPHMVDPSAPYIADDELEQLIAQQAQQPIVFDQQPIQYASQEMDQQYIPQDVVPQYMQQVPEPSYFDAIQRSFYEYFTRLAHAIWRNSPEPLKDALARIALPWALWRR